MTSLEPLALVVKERSLAEGSDLVVFSPFIVLVLGLELTPKSVVSDRRDAAYGRGTLSS